MKNQIALITGATSGIVKASAFLFAKNGYDLILTGRREDRLIEIQNTIQSTSNAAITVLCFDIQNTDEMKKQILFIKDKLSKIDILINNAGLALGKGSFEDGLLSDWETMIETNIKGLIYMTKEIIPFMIANNKGHIINVSSTAARDMYPGGNVYSATKCAVDGFTKSLRIDLLKYNIKVSSVTPGMVDTEFSTVRFHGDKEKADSVYKGFKPLSAADVADSIYYIASRPEHVHIGDILITCTAQVNSNLVLKK